MPRTVITLPTEKMLAYTEDGIGWMVFNNPERHNALTLEMQAAVPLIFEAFGADETVRVVVMRGAGDRAFVSGADIGEFDRREAQAASGEPSPPTPRSWDDDLYQRLGKPVIAMVRGYCLGGGVLTMLKADIRVASDDAQFGVPAAKLGVGYGPAGVKALLEVVGPAYTREILLTGERFSAQDALRMGLVNRVVPAADLEATVIALARTIAENAPLTIRAVRAAVDELMKAPADRDLARVEALVATAAASDDFREGRRAFREKRKPRFTGR